MACPKCNGEVIIEGKIYNQVDYINPQAYFRPTNAPFYAMLSSNARVENLFSACMLCGLIWSSLNKDDLKQFWPNVDPGRQEVTIILRKIAVLFVLLFIPLWANASDEKGWYPFMQNRGWYPTEGQSSSTGSAADAGNSAMQPTPQPAANSTQSVINPSSQINNQQAQSSSFTNPSQSTMNTSPQSNNQQAQSSFFK